MPYDLELILKSIDVCTLLSPVDHCFTDTIPFSMKCIIIFFPLNVLYDSIYVPTVRDIYRSINNQHNVREEDSFTVLLAKAHRDFGASPLFHIMVLNDGRIAVSNVHHACILTTTYIGSCIVCQYFVTFISFAVSLV